MSEKHEVSCWHCHEMTSLETRNEFDGCCWACGAEIDLEEYLIHAMDKHDEHYAALSAVTAERDRLMTEVERLRACIVADDVNFDRLAKEYKTLQAERDQLRVEADALRNDAERYQVRLETIRALFPNAPSDAELDIAIDAAMAAKEGCDGPVQNCQG